MSINDNEKIISHKVKFGYKNCQTNISYFDKTVIGNGTFGVVYGATLNDSNEKVAIKRVFQDKRYKNRELQIMKMLQHPNIISLLYYFIQYGEKEDTYLNLIMEFLPETVYDLIRKYRSNRSLIPCYYIKIFAYQMFRGLAYMHSKKIVHRDIKPTNLLVNMESGILKLCDFGSAKILVDGQPNVAYICSRFYRAPELILGYAHYSCAIDVWSVGCVIAEMMLGRALFSGQNNIDQLVEIIKIMGSPSTDQIRDMNPNYNEFKLPKMTSIPFEKLFPKNTDSDSIHLLTRLLEYSPSVRLTALESLVHSYFNEVRSSSFHLPNNGKFPSLLDFSLEELSIKPSLNHLLKPE